MRVCQKLTFPLREYNQLLDSLPNFLTSPVADTGSCLSEEFSDTTTDGDNCIFN